MSVLSKLENLETISLELVRYLEKHQSMYLDMWRETIIVDPNDVNKELIIANGEQMYELVKKTIQYPITEENIKQLAFKVARERLDANINIGHFVYNVNLGRSIILKGIIQLGIAHDFLTPIVDNINRQFDLFCYHATAQYTELKNQELHEKNTFITQTHKERLAILGQMSSSFVHEFRNPLTAVIGFIKLLKSESPQIKYIDIIDAELQQLNFRITQFLHTSKVNVIEEHREVTSINDLLHDVLHFLYPSIVDGDVSITTNFTAEIAIKINKDQIKQVILNILMNSIEATKKNDKSKEIEVRCNEVDGKGKVVINISNNGPSIPEHTLKTIFEPFYTTKELGTGIGLFVCKNIIEKHKGHIICSSNENKTTFSIYLPK